MTTAADALLEVEIDDLKRMAHNSSGVFLEMGEVNNESAGAFPAGARVFTSASRAAIYSTSTGDVSIVTVDMLAKKLKSNAAGVKEFSPTPIPGKTYETDAITGFPKLVREGTVLCLLHPDHPERPWIDSIGLRGRYCAQEPGQPPRGKSNIPGEFYLRRHMAHKHQDEWKTIQDARIEMERQESMALQREQIEAMKSLAMNQAARPRNGGREA